jgi:hypothetical protein
VGLNAGAFRTTLVFGNGERVGLRQLATTAGFEWRINSRVTLSLGAGALVLGELATPTEAFRAAPGFAGSFAAAFTVVEQKGAIPFVMLTGQASSSAVPTTAGTYVAIDLRASVVAGYTLFERFTPYLTARAFGGPVLWRGSTGTDLYHYQFGLGAVVGLPAGFDLSAEVVPLGEQRVSAAVGYSF